MSQLYQVVFGNKRLRKEFYKALKKFPRNDQKNIVDAVEYLAKDPRPAGKSFKPLKGELLIFSHLPQCRIRVGDYRVFYDIEDSLKKVYIIAVRRRREDTYE